MRVAFGDDPFGCDSPKALVDPIAHEVVAESGRSERNGDPARPAQTISGGLGSVDAEGVVVRFAQLHTDAGVWRAIGPQKDEDLLVDLHDPLAPWEILMGAREVDREITKPVP